MKKNTYSLLLTTGYLLLTPAAYAQITNPVLPTGVGSGGIGAGGTIVGNIISALTGLFLVGGTIAALLFLLLGAFRWITSSGDKTKLQTAQDQITNAIIGLVVMAAAWAIMMLVGQFTGIGVFGANGWNINLPGLGRSGPAPVVAPVPAVPAPVAPVAPFVPPAGPGLQIP